MDEGLWSNQIDKMMKKYKNFKGTVAADQLKSIEVKPDDEYVGFIMNTAKANSMGEHWVSWFISTRPHDRSIEYFDSFGEKPKLTHKMKVEIKRIAKTLSPKLKLKMKVNGIQRQNVKTSTCGFHAMSFLIKRFKDIPFVKATGYHHMRRKIDDLGEEEAEKMRKEMLKKHPEFKTYM